MLLQGWNSRGCLAAFSRLFYADFDRQCPGSRRPAPAGPSGRRTNYRVAERTDPAGPVPVSQMHPGDPSEHPLMPALRWAREGLPGIEKIQDYTATLIKRERIGANLWAISSTWPSRSATSPSAST